MLPLLLHNKMVVSRIPAVVDLNKTVDVCLSHCVALR